MPNPDHISTTYGIVRDSILNKCYCSLGLLEYLLILFTRIRSAYFHVVDGLAPDVLHDVLEGLLQYEVELLLRFLIYEDHLCTLHQLNQRLEMFNYG